MKISAFWMGACLVFLLITFGFVELYHFTKDTGSGFFSQMGKKQWTQAQHDAWPRVEALCSMEQSLARIQTAADELSALTLVSVATEQPQPCHQTHRWFQSDTAIDCYPLTLQWQSTFLDGVAFMQRYQAECAWMYRDIKINVIDYPQTFWEVSGWYVSKVSS